MLEAMADAAVVVFAPERLMYMFGGVLMGLTLGIIPGLGGLVGMALLLPFLFGMDPFTGIAMLIGITVVGATSDTFPSVLLGIPGSAGSQATILDGYPMAQKGEASRALGASFSASLVGGLLGALLLLVGIVTMRPVVLALGSPELLMMALLGISMVAVLARGAILPGLVAAAIGLMLGSIGGAPAAMEYRYTFGTLYLFDGVHIAVVALGLFAIPEILTLLAEDRPVASKKGMPGSLLRGMMEAWAHKFLVLRSAVVGTIIGMIPGLGGAVVDWIAYGFAKQTCKNPETFGKGDIRGVIAPESANNAKEGGSMLPTLMFGIPGSSAGAVLLGGLMLMGLQTGPAMVDDHLDVTLTIVWGIAIANVMAVVVCLLMSPQMARVARVPPKWLAPFLFVILVIGAYQTTRHWGDILALLGIGILGLCLKEAGWPRSPVIIGFVLATSVERYLHISVERYGTDFMRRPIVVGMGLFIVAFILLSARRGRRKAGISQEGDHEARDVIR